MKKRNFFFVIITGAIVGFFTSLFISNKQKNKFNNIVDNSKCKVKNNLKKIVREISVNIKNKLKKNKKNETRVDKVEDELGT